MKIKGYISPNSVLFTHSAIVDIAHKWVLNKTSCGIAFKELKTISSEIADVIGFGSGSFSVLVECKISKSDFLRDKKKSFRINPEMGVGRYRFYCCPSGLIKPSELPERWGLIYINEKGKAECIVNPYCKNINGNMYSNGFPEYNKEGERAILYSCLRRNKKN